MWQDEVSHRSEMAGSFNRGDTIINKHFTLYCQNQIISDTCLTPCMMGNFACFSRLLILFLKKKYLFQKFLSGITPYCQNSLDPGQARRRNVGPDLGPNCLQTFSTEDTSRLIIQLYRCE